MVKPVTDDPECPLINFKRVKSTYFPISSVASFVNHVVKCLKMQLFFWTFGYIACPYGLTIYLRFWKRVLVVEDGVFRRLHLPAIATI